MSASAHTPAAPSARRSPRAPVSIFDSSASASRAAALEIATLIRAQAAKGQKAVLGLATGSTPTGVYDELVRMHREEKLSFANVVTFNLDEYFPMPPDAFQSYRRFMNEHLFDLVDIPKNQTHVPDGTVAPDKLAQACADYEQRIKDAGGVQLQILGIGRTGHIGFNEPGSPRASRTRLITLDKVTRLDAASDFFGEWNVPKQAVTMGVGTILDAKRVLLLAFGEGKAKIIREALEGEVTQSIAASFLQEHPAATFLLDSAAASELTPVKTPWLLGPLAEFGLQWDDATTKRAVMWLADKVRKPILKLVGEDYNEHGLQELLSARGSAYNVNITVFKQLQNTITGWPGGKKDRPKLDGSADPFPKRIVVFSPHPDDDVISMGGTFIRLCDQGHDVHVAYQTSGNIAVWDEEALRHCDFVSEFARAFEIKSDKVDGLIADVQRFIGSKAAGAIDIAALQTIKGLIRRTEARAAARYSGVKPSNIHFLDMPFYETGRVRKKPLGEEDIAIIVKVLETVKPHQIYAAGDLSDPHGTHRVCLAAIEQAVLRLREKQDWIRECAVWYYRGAWQEWEPHEIEMAVPLSPDEVERKRMAIFKHESQKDKALFPGPWDMREFWKRAEDRNRETAAKYDRLGLPEYEAIEAFVRWDPAKGAAHAGKAAKAEPLRRIGPA
ncbi:MAG: glucosamine-6-phosphate deaminase [Phycisphaerae bacterium]|nr:glucosamine-6-phosphate deaminase [Phycisphaerae bacterium]